MTQYKPTLVLMAGFPGSGKTTIAAGLGCYLNWPVLDKDLLKLTLMNLKLGLSPDVVGSATYELLFAVIEDIVVKQQLSAILDTAAIQHFILDQATTIVQGTGVRLKIILCVAERDLRIERLSKRTSPDIFHTSPVDYTTQDNEFSYFAHLPADTLTLETAYPLKDCLKQAIQYLTQNEKSSS